MTTNRTLPALTCSRRSHAVCILALLGLSLARIALGADLPSLVHEGKWVRVPEGSPYRTRIAVEPARLESQSHAVSVPGIIEADPALTVNILPPLTGRLVELSARVGQTVSAGQVLARVRSPDLLQAVSDAEKSRDAYDLALKARDRAHDVYAAGGNSIKDVESAESSLVQARSEQARAQQRLQVLGARGVADASTASLPIEAPIDGVITALNVGANAVINDPTASLMSVAHLREVFVTAQLPEALLGEVRVGQHIEAIPAAYPNRILRGQVSSIAATLDPDSRRTPARTRIANPDLTLKPNMFVRVKFLVNQVPQVIVPLSALVMSNDRVLVFVEGQPGSYEPREVQLGLEEGDRVRITSGLKAGERVVVRGGVLLND